MGASLAWSSMLLKSCSTSIGFRDVIQSKIAWTFLFSSNLRIGKLELDSERRNSIPAFVTDFKASRDIGVIYVPARTVRAVTAVVKVLRPDMVKVVAAAAKVKMFSTLLFT